MATYRLPEASSLGRRGTCISTLYVLNIGISTESYEENIHQTCGLSRLRTRLEGISKRTYGTKNMVNAMLISLPLSFKSLVKPNMRALEMLTLGIHLSWRTSGILAEPRDVSTYRSKNANRYIITNTGMTLRSTLLIRARSVV